MLTFWQMFPSETQASPNLHSFGMNRRILGVDFTPTSSSYHDGTDRSSHFASLWTLIQIKACRYTATKPKKIHNREITGWAVLYRCTILPLIRRYVNTLNLQRYAQNCQSFKSGLNWVIIEQGTRGTLWKSLIDVCGEFNLHVYKGCQYLFCPIQLSQTSVSRVGQTNTGLKFVQSSAYSPLQWKTDHKNGDSLLRTRISTEKMSDTPLTPPAVFTRSLCCIQCTS